MTKINRFSNNNLSEQTVCNVCGSGTIALHHGHYTPESPISWDSRSIMQLLGLSSMHTALRVCTHCLHMFRWPLYWERCIYSAEGDRCRKENFEKANAGQTFRGGDGRFDPEWFAKSARVFNYLSRLLASGFSSDQRGFVRTEPIRILDWGGGDGYISETISLISNKVLSVPCHAYCYDFTDWNATNSPYFECVSLEEVPQHGPYDIIILSHILEHTSFPIDTVNQCAQYLRDHGLLLIVVPYEQPTWLFQKDTSPAAHQSAFSATSISHLLGVCGFRCLNIELAYLSYRVFPMWNILVSAIRTNDQTVRKLFPLWKDLTWFGKALCKQFH